MTNTSHVPPNDASPDADPPLGRIAGAFTKPLGWRTHALACCAFFWTCWDVRLPGGGPSVAILVGVLLWAWVAMVWLTRPVAALMLKLRAGKPVRLLLARWPHWCVAPLLLALNILAVAYAIPAQLAFHVSRPSADRLAEQVLADGKERPNQWVGVIPISRAQLVNGAVQLDFARDEIPWGERGMYFSPDDTAVENSHYYSQSKLKGGWYTWHYGGW
ncbi:MAG: hypothetical protein ABIP55_12140 [Tepidisphaeraceae bacterium]